MSTTPIELTTAAPDPGEQSEAAPQPVDRPQAFLARALRRPSVVVPTGVLVFLFFLGVASPLFRQHDPVQQNLGNRYATPSLDHLVGTDQYGQDIFSRLLASIQVDFVAVGAAVALSLVVGVGLGSIVGLVGGWLDSLMMRLADALFSIPPLVLVLMVIGVTGRGLFNSMLGVAIAFALTFMRVVRAELISLREEPWVAAARMSGLSMTRILTRHLAPSLARPLVVQIALMLRTGFLVEASLSYFGLSVQPPDPSLGSLLRAAQDAALEAPWQVLPAGLLLVVIVWMLNLISDGLADMIAPKRAPERLLASAARPVAKLETTMAMAAPARPVLDISGLRIGVGDEDHAHDAVRGVDLQVQRAEIMALVGESGAGKTLIAMAAAGLLPEAAKATGGRIEVDGHDLAAGDGGLLRAIRSQEIGVVFQDPIACMNPTWTVGRHLTSVLRTIHGMSKPAARRRAAELLHEVGVTNIDARMKMYPHQLSGGIAQRVMIAQALAGTPRLLIADEATSALDSTIEVRVLDLFERLRTERGLSILFVTHSMGVVAGIADRVTVLYAGEVVEDGTTREVLSSPKHPYTKALLAAVPTNTPRTGPLLAVGGGVPAPNEHGDGCSFAARCDERIADCEPDPVPVAMHGDRSVRCVHFAPEVVS